MSNGIIKYSSKLDDLFAHLVVVLVDVLSTAEYPYAMAAYYVHVFCVLSCLVRTGAALDNGNYINHLNSKTSMELCSTLGRNTLSI